jgi:phosphatidate cytidylyltransferase
MEDKQSSYIELVRYLVTTIWTLSVIFLGLIIASAVLYLMRKNEPDKDFSGILLRAKTWWGMFAVFCLATLFNPILSLLSLMVLCFFSLKEYFSMMKFLFMYSYSCHSLDF